MLTVKPTIDKDGMITDSASIWEPTDQERERLKDIHDSFHIADRVRTTKYAEFNYNGYDQDLISYMNEMAKRFNVTPPTPSDDPDQAWHANIVDPMTRNKVMSVLSNVTLSLMEPSVVAQNDDSQEDKQMSLVMDDAVAWANDQAEYKKHLLSSIQEMCVYPGVILQQDYTKAFRTIKEIQPDGSFKMKDIEDDIYSGYKMSVVPLDELYISNVYEPDIQKQDFIIRIQLLSYDQALREVPPEKKADFIKYVQPGQRVVFSQEQNMFFEKRNENISDIQVEKITYYHAQADLELRIFNGWLMDNPDRPLQRKDKKYPFTGIYGYERFNSRFFYYVPLVARQIGSQDMLDMLQNMTLDATFYQLSPPVAGYGSEDIDASSLAPGQFLHF